MRDQTPSNFAGILQSLVDATSGSLGAALVDREGETVDYAGQLDPFDIRVAAAHVQLVMRHANEDLGMHIGNVLQLLVQADDRSYLARILTEGYAIVLVFTSESAFRVSERAMVQAEHDLRSESGWPLPDALDSWNHVRVRVHSSDQRTPEIVLLCDRWHQVEVIGTAVNLADGEIGYRVRLDVERELTLIREASGRWYADVRVEQ